MLDLIEEGIYKKTWQILLGVDQIPEELRAKCDMVTSVGGMGWGHQPPEAMEMILQFLKKGGIYVFDIRGRYWNDDENTQYPYKQTMQKLIDDGKYRLVKQHWYQKGTQRDVAGVHDWILCPQDGYILFFQKMCD